MNTGWIKIHRKIVDWEWFGNSAAVHLFVFLIASAEIEDTVKRSVTVHKGQLLTSLNEIQVSTHLTIKQIRYWLDKFELSHEIVKGRAGKFLLITISKYDDYQDNSKAKGQRNGTTKSKKGHETKEKEENPSPTPPLKEETRKEEEGKKEKSISMEMPKNLKKGDLQKMTEQEICEWLKNCMRQFVPEFGRDMCNNFYFYWTDHDVANDGKMRIQCEQQFYLYSRLRTWWNKESKGK